MGQFGQAGKTLIRVFVAAIISAMLTVGITTLTGGDAAAWREVGEAGLTAVFTAALVYVDPKDTRYGVGRV